MRSLLRMVAELVILHEKKLIIWCSLPATQIFVDITLRALHIPTACYTSELDFDQRNKLVAEFTTTNAGAQVFIGSYYIGSTGLNLQYYCHHSGMFDAPPNEGSKKQALGRSRRIGQAFTVENFEFSVINSFQNR